ncbi:hypothetical protein GGF40_002496 [Coemansia sp. RSA 1286]|nr:hypothetical protein GGF40_002496 [Coemansia sp. RSA 1286]
MQSKTLATLGMVSAISLSTIVLGQETITTTTDIISTTSVSLEEEPPNELVDLNDIQQESDSGKPWHGHHNDDWDSDCDSDSDDDSDCDSDSDDDDDCDSDDESDGIDSVEDELAYLSDKGAGVHSICSVSVATAAFVAMLSVVNSFI